MKAKKITKLFYAIAGLAARSGMEFSLEQADSRTSAKALNGSLTNNQSRSAGLTLRCWLPQPAADTAETDEEADSDDANDDC